MVVHTSSSTWLPSRILGRVGRLHSLPRRFQRVLQSAPPLGSLHNRQHLRSPHELQADRQDQRQHLSALHLVPGNTPFHCHIKIYIFTYV